MRDDMISGLFGAMTCENRMNIIANNLANANTTGFKREQIAFEDVFIRYAHDEIRQPVLYLREKELFPEAHNMAKVRIAGMKTDMSQGHFKNSDNPLDVAIGGEGFFKVQTDAGQFYTRNGNFHITAEGGLVTAEGMPVLGEGGPIVLPPNTRIEINTGGQIFADGQAVAQLQVVNVENAETALEKVGQNMFRGRNGQNVVEQPSDATINQGFLETANINVVEEMVNMIECSRAFEAYSKVMSTSHQTCLSNINKVGKT